MKATLPIAALAMLSSAITASAQNPVVKPCIHCEIKEKVIKDLKMQIRTLQEHTTETAATGHQGSTPSTQVQESPQTAPVHTAASEVQHVANTETNPATTPTEAPSTTSLYTVQPGDNVFKIAATAACNPETLLSLNGLTMESVIHPGQKLKLPKATSAATAATATQPQTYRIQEGDTYYSLSQRLKIPLNELMAANPKAKATELYAGRTINLPTTGSTPPATPTDTDATASGISAAPEETAALGSAVVDPQPAPQPEKKILTIKVEQAISYGDFAAKYGTNVERLNSLNDLNLTGTTTLAKGSELYVPAQP